MRVTRIDFTRGEGIKRESRGKPEVECHDQYTLQHLCFPCRTNCCSRLTHKLSGGICHVTRQALETQEVKTFLWQGLKQKWLSRMNFRRKKKSPGNKKMREGGWNKRKRRGRRTDSKTNGYKPVTRNPFHSSGKGEEEKPAAFLRFYW